MYALYYHTNIRNSISQCLYVYAKISILIVKSKFGPLFVKKLLKVTVRMQEEEVLEIKTIERQPLLIFRFKLLVKYKLKVL